MLAVYQHSGHRRALSRGITQTSRFSCLYSIKNRTGDEFDNLEHTQAENKCNHAKRERNNRRDVDCVY